MNIFYTPENASVGDVIPFYDEGKFKPFYLKNWYAYKGEDRVDGWHMLTTEDHINFTEHPTRICGGTGSVIKVDNLYHMFYCTFTHNPERQFACHAISTDLVMWTTIPEDTFTADGEIYEITDWRDPFVFWNEEEQLWWMILAAQKRGKTNRKGCVALCVSKDLKKWEYREPLYAPGIHQSAHECPDFFKMGEWYYLIYSAYTDRFQTFYRMSKTLNGPWITPAVDTFDTRAFYAAKTGTDGKERYIYGWNPTRKYNLWKFDPETDMGDDYKTWDWGGTMIVHKLLQNPDGTLHVAVIDNVDEALKSENVVEMIPMAGNWKIGGNNALIDSSYGFASLLMNYIPRLCKLEVTVSFEKVPRQFGIAMQVDETFSEGYYACLEPHRERLQYKTGLRMYEDGGKMFPYEVEMERPIKLEPDIKYKVRIFIEDSVLVIYVNDEIALSTRMFNRKRRRFGLFVSEGSASFENIKLFTE